MGSGRDKRKKLKPTAPGAGQAKTERKTAAAEEKRQRRAEKGADEDDIEALLARARLEEASCAAVSIDAVPPPCARSNVSLTPLPVAAGKPPQLLLVGGECVDAGGRTRVFSDVLRFDTGKRAWAAIRSPGAPPPRSAHQAVAYKHYVYMFGGEFTSPNQARRPAHVPPRSTRAGALPPLQGLVATGHHVLGVGAADAAWRALRPVRSQTGQAACAHRSRRPAPATAAWCTRPSCSFLAASTTRARRPSAS